MGQDIVGPDPTTDRGPYNIDPGLLIKDNPNHIPDEELENTVYKSLWKPNPELGKEEKHTQLKVFQRNH